MVKKNLQNGRQAEWTLKKVRTTSQQEGDFFLNGAPSDQLAATYKRHTTIVYHWQFIVYE